MITDTHTYTDTVLKFKQQTCMNRYMTNDDIMTLAYQIKEKRTKDGPINRR